MNYYNLWAKADKDSIHPLWAHMFDVSKVAEILWDKKSSLHLVNNDLEKQYKNIFAAFAGLHDIGKATPSFQIRKKEIYRSLENYDDYFSKVSSSRKRHDYLSYLIIYKWAQDTDLTDGQRTFTQFISSSLYAHHGNFEKLQKKDVQMFARYSKRSPLGKENWKALQQELINNHLKLLNVSINDIPEFDEHIFEYLPFFSGWITLADWLASDEKYFPYYDGNQSDYQDISAQRARQAVIDSGLENLPDIEADSFKAAFPEIDQPRKLQEICSNIEIANHKPNLTIIEAPTGEGKTEAALHLAQRIMKKKNSNGIYVAMPTQATSKGLFDRFEEFCRNIDKMQQPNIKLIHGGVILEELIKKYEAKSADIYTDNSENERFSWFTKKKRSLLATYGVGTVDQTFFSVLAVKHFFLRLYALAGKVLIFDEVHAYDFYMSEIFYRLLEHLKANNTDVVILSATLPTAFKKKLASAWNPDISFEPTDDYPVISHSTNEIMEYNFVANSSRQLEVKFIADGTENLSNEALFAYNSGARVAVICNSVDRAQKTYSTIKNNIKNQTEKSDNAVVLLHSRFTKQHRQEIEQNVLSRFGKKTHDVSPAIVVATQIIEQSLDIDFDYMISEISPVDLLIQRAGRLHRHDWKKRPPGFDKPILTIATPPEDDDMPPNFENIAFVYDEITMLRTYFAIKNRRKMTFPQDFRILVDEVYPEDDEEWIERNRKMLSEEAIEKIYNSITKKENENLKSKGNVGWQLIPSPNKMKEIIQYSNFKYHEEGETRRSIRAKTREGEESYNLCLLFKNGEEYFTDPKYENRIIVDSKKRNDILTIKFLKNEVGLSNMYIYSYLKDNQPDWWVEFQKKNPTLSNHFLLVFEGEQQEINEKLSIKYDKVIGLTYIRGDNAEF